jgi:hypothetical protein
MVIDCSYKYIPQLERLERFDLYPIKHPKRNKSLSYESDNVRENASSTDVEGFLEKYPMRYLNRAMLAMYAHWFAYSLNPFLDCLCESV